MNVIGKLLCSLLVVILQQVHSAYNDFTENDVMNDIVWRIKLSRKIRLVTIYSQRADHLSPNSVNFIRNLATELPVLMINTTELLVAPTNKRLNGVRNWLHSRSQRKSLNVLFVDRYKEDENITQLLMEHIKHLETLSLKTSRPKVILFLLNFRTGLNLRKFLEYTWSLKYLDVVVIELIKSMRDKGINSHSEENFTAFIHQYNPFSDTYYKESPLEIRTKKLFIQKLNNLHGYTLHAGLTDGMPQVMMDRNYTGNEAWGMVEGLDVMITRTLIETLNFKTNIKVTSTSDNPRLKQFNVSHMSIDNALKEEAIDFAVNFYGMVGSKRLEDFDFESSIFLYPYTSNLIVKQYGKTARKISRNFVIIVFMMAITLISFTFGRWLLRLNLKMWNSYKILQIILCNPMAIKLETIYERIFYLSLAAVSFLFSLNLLEQLMGIYLWQDTFAELHSLQDVVDAEVVPSITSESKRLIYPHNHTAFKTLMEHSTTIQYEDLPDCVNLLINHKSVNGCEVNSIVGRLITNSFSDKERGWIVTFVEEPIVPACWTAMLFTKTSPYITKFDQILRKISEAGLLTVWKNDMLANFTINYKNFFGEEKLHHTDTIFNRNYIALRINKTSLNKTLSFFLIMGHMISCFVFMCEFIIGHLWRTRP